MSKKYLKHLFNLIILARSRQSFKSLVIKCGGRRVIKSMQLGLRQLSCKLNLRNDGSKSDQLQFFCWSTSKIFSLNILELEKLQLIQHINADGLSTLLHDRTTVLLLQVPLHFMDAHGREYLLLVLHEE